MLKERELELEIVCTSCKKRFKNFRDLLVWHIPSAIIRDLKIKQKPHLKCPFCRNNTFWIKVMKDKYGEYKYEER